jgi:hypothetical protein
VQCPRASSLARAGGQSDRAAAAPTQGAGPRVPSPLDQTGLPDVASRGSDSNPSPTRCPTRGPTDHLGTSARSAQGPGPPGPTGRQPVRKRTTPAHHPRARSLTAEPTVSFASESPSPKNFLTSQLDEVAFPSSGEDGRSSRRRLVSATTRLISAFSRLAAACRRSARSSTRCSRSRSR